MSNNLRDKIKQIAADNGVSVNELIALSSQNDPFFMGSPSQERDARWFANLWRRRYPTDDDVPSEGINLRGMHYYAQSFGDVVLPCQVSWRVATKDGKKAFKSTETYINNMACWKYLCRAAKAARYLGYVNPALFYDAKGGEVQQNTPYPLTPDDYNYTDKTPRFEVSGGWFVQKDMYGWPKSDSERFVLPELPELPDLPDLPTQPYLSAEGYHTEQKYIFEVWTEKSGIVPIISPICKQYNANIVIGQGELSITACLQFVERARKYNKPVVILYVSDYDPAGYQMAMSVSRKIEYFLALTDSEDLQIILQPVILTYAQIEKYNLPTVPAKDTDVRFDVWNQKHGENNVVELDSLEALYPGIMNDMLEEYILRYVDPSYRLSVQSTRQEFQADLDDASMYTREKYRDDLEMLESDYDQLLENWKDTQDAFAQMIQPFQDQIDQYQSELERITTAIAELHDNMRDDLRYDGEGVIVPEQPEHVLPHENDDTKLFDSSREYMEQIKYYNARKDNTDLDTID